MENLYLADLSKNNDKYLRRDIDGGILTDKYDIDRYKQQQYVDVVDNLMLGNYNEFGEYIIQDDIKNELLKCRKIVEDSYENILFVRSINSVNVFSTLSFAIRILNLDDIQYCSATLELLEPIYKAKGLIENTQATTILKIKIKNDQNLKSEVFERFNIIPKDDPSGARKEFNYDDEFENTLTRKIKLLYIKNKIKEFQEQEEEICFKKNKAELEKTAEGKKILQEYYKDEKIMQNYLKVDKDDYKSKNEALTSQVEKSDYKNSNVFSNLARAAKNTVEVIQDIAKSINSKEEKNVQMNTRTNNKKAVNNEAKLDSLLDKIDVDEKLKKSELDGLLNKIGISSEKNKAEGKDRKDPFISIYEKIN